MLPLPLTSSCQCYATDSHTNWYCHFCEATVNKMLYQDLLDWRKNSTTVLQAHAAFHSPLLCAAFLGFLMLGTAVPSVHYNSELDCLYFPPTKHLHFGFDQILD